MFDPEPHAVDCWLLSLRTLPDDETLSLVGLLSDAEREQAGAFRIERLRDGFVARRAALRLLLSRYLRVAPETLQIAYERNGRPVLTGTAEPLHFNLSHSGDLVLVAVSRTAPVGIDIEAVRDIPALEDVVRDNFSGAEYRAWQRQPAEARLPSFFVTWTRKEAFIKALGLGMSVPLQSFDTGPPDGAPSLILDGARSREWSLADLHPAAGYVGALATPRPRVSLRARDADWRWLLAAAAPGGERADAPACGMSPRGRAR